MTYKIDAKTATGAANQLARALRRELKRRHPEVDADDIVIAREDEGRIEVIWEEYAPHEWTIIGAGGGAIWMEEDGYGLGAAFKAPATFECTNPDILLEPINGCVMGVYKYQGFSNDSKREKGDSETMATELMCVICGKSVARNASNRLWLLGNNPAPVAGHGKACDRCDREQVLPARIRQLAMRDRR